MTGNSAHRAFTLIELLVVIGTTLVNQSGWFLNGVI
jgi:competence protein ComGC